MNNLLEVLRVIGRVLLWGAVALLILVAVFFGINAVDEDLRPEVATALQTVKPLVAHEENAFFALVGLTAPAGADAREHGQRWIAEANAAADSLQMRAVEEKYKKSSLSFAQIKGPYCSALTENCFDKARRDPDQVRKIRAANEDLLKRHEALLGYPRFEDLSPPLMVAAAPSYEPVLIAQSLKHAEIALQIEEGRVEEGLAGFEAQAAFDRRFLAGSRLLVSNTAAVTALSNDLLFLAELLRVKREELAPFAARIVAQAPPLGIEDRRLDRVFASEFRFVATVVRLYGTQGAEDALGIKQGILGGIFGLGPEALARGGHADLLDPVLPWFLKKNATLNLLAHRYASFSDLSKQPPAGLTEDFRALARQTRDEVYNWRLPYNPIGKWVSAKGTQAELGDYVFRMHDLDALARAVALNAAMLAQGTLDAGVASFIAASDQKLFDPYTGQPMQWDVASGQIWFVPASNWMRQYKIGARADRVAVSLWPAVPAQRP